MFATMARHSGRVQLKQADLCIALNMVNMAKNGISHTEIEETKNEIINHQAEFREEKRWGIELPGHKRVKVVIEKHAFKIYNDYLDGCLRCQNKIA
jgi:hypothetical protein